MITISGKHASAHVFTEVLEEKAADQIKTLCCQEYVAGSKIRIMPDVHAGAGCTIGTTMTITDKVVPNLVGVDIGCGMESVRVKQRELDLQKLDGLIYTAIPSGFDVRKTVHPFCEEIDLDALRCASEVNLKRARCSIGTLGGGNHFIEVDQDADENLYIVIHSGSRHLGLEVAEYYQSEGYRRLNQNDRESIASLIARYKAQGREKEIQDAINEVHKQIITDIPRDLAYVSGDLFDDYLHDMKIVQRFAALNRKAMMQEIVHGMLLDIEEQFTTTHNYIDTDSMILRKGAVSAKAGEKLLIPINMRDGSLICIGKGNPDWNESAPHGAGRICSRMKARKEFTLSEFEKQMEGIFTTSVRKDTLDECPMAYKDMDDIIQNIGTTADIVNTIKPVYNYKAGGD